VTVIAQGTRERQHIQLYLRDDRNVRSVVAEQWLDPGQKIEKTVTTHGSASFELYRDGEPVGRAPLPLPSGPRPAEEPGEH
jgi:hypothetical protein